MRRSNAIFGVVAAFALAAGTLVYLADRPAPPALFVGASALLAMGPLFGTLGQWLPSFAHPFAFSLLTAAARPAGSPPAYGACWAWWAINVAFEIGQHPAVRAPLAATIHDLLGDAWAGHRLADYFIHGAFDVGDLVAVTLGALAAAALLRGTHRWEVRHASR